MSGPRKPLAAPSLPDPDQEAPPPRLEEEGGAPLAPEGEEPVEVGPEVIRRLWRTLPESPGVYRMFDAAGNLLYVGKARSLRARVSAYTSLTGHVLRIQRMIAATASMIFVVTRTETEALLLEANLIKQLKPRYNVLLRDDKSFPYILIAEETAAPRLTRWRGARSVKGRYFGPFASGQAVSQTIAQLQKAFLLRTCADSVYANRSRPCLLHQIKRCSAPCVDLVAPEAYAELVSEAADFLDGRSTKIQERLAVEMSEAAAAMEYERAAALRDRIRALSAVQARQDVNVEVVSEADVFALHLEGGQACVQVFFYRGGQNWGNRAYFPRLPPEADEEAILDAVIGQFYATRPAPRLLLISHKLEKSALMEAALTEAAGRKVEIQLPQRGDKKVLVEQALRNARESLARRLADSAAQGRLLIRLGEALELEAPPSRIDVYDNSHIMGRDAVGAMVVMGPEGWLKNEYRKFNIKGEDLTPGDDFGMMKEVLRRRFERLQREDPDRTKGLWPDLTIIDGGAGQLSAAEAILAEMGVEDLELLAIAKGQDRDAGKEMLHRPGRSAFALPHRDPTLYFLQRLRDEAHRFAIGAHRARRAKTAAVNPLDEIEGVGPTRKRAILAHFGSAKAAAEADLAELARAPGVSEALARRIYEHFHGEG